jgi:autotransporter-associated beta strand protein
LTPAGAFEILTINRVPVSASPSGESYAITPSDSSKAITLKSALATNWHVSVLSGEHEVGANIIMAAGTGQSVIRLANDSHLTLSKVLSDETTMASSGLNFRGDFVLGTAPGRLTLSGANTYTGPTVVTNGILEVATLTDGGSASSIGDSPAAAANLVLNNATLKYTGPAVAIDRGFTVVGSAATLETANDLTFGGSVVSSGSIALTKNGTGALTLGDVNTGTSDLTLTNNGASVVTLSNVTTNVLDFRGIGGALSMTNASLKDFNVTGLVNVQTGDTITLSGGSYSRLNVGLVADAAIQQTGGTFEVLSTDWYNGMIGNNNYGYYGLSGGTLHLNGFLSIGELGLGVFEQSGGIFNADSGFSIGALWAIRGGGVYNLTGGTMNQSDGYDGIIYIGMGGNGELNVSGTGAGATFCVPAFMMAYWRRATTQGMAASMITFWSLSNPWYFDPSKMSSPLPVTARSRSRQPRGASRSHAAFTSSISAIDSISVSASSRILRVG